MTVAPADSLLLSPITVGSKVVKNRLVSTAHGVGFDFEDPRDTGDRYLAYQERRAAGGVGLIVLESAWALPAARPDGAFPLDYMRERLTRMGSALHRHGTTVVQQVIHVGAQLRSDAAADLQPLWSFSGLPTSDGEATHEMTEEEVESVVNGFAHCARIAVESGLDGIELHAAHGYLLQQSFSPWSNQRDDAWGEPLRFARAVISRVREAVGREPIVGLRMSVDDFRSADEGGVGIDRSVELAAALVADGQLDFLNHSEGSRHEHYARAVGTWRHPHGEFLPLTARLRAGIDGAIPVIGVGRVVSPLEAEAAIRDGTCDLVAMTRALIADPDLLAKFTRGDVERIRPCVGSNQGCQDRRGGLGLFITCFHNPEVGLERELGEVVPAPRSKTVVVVGGGPAGLKAAELAARRGHDVTLVEQGPELGGKLLLAGRLPAAVELLGSVRWVIAELADLGVRIMTETTADRALVEQFAPEAVVLATGARPEPLAAVRGKTDGSVDVISAEDAMTADLAGRSVVVLDLVGAFDAVFAAERLARAGARVTIAAPRPVVGAYIGSTHQDETPLRLVEVGCTLLPQFELSAAGGGSVELRHVLTGERRGMPADAVVVSTPGRPRTELRRALVDAGIEVRVVGDAVAARSAMLAFREGDRAGREI